MRKWNEFIGKDFVVCPHCGYYNEEKRFQLYGTCLRCHKIVDKKIYLKRRYWESKSPGSV